MKKYINSVSLIFSFLTISPSLLMGYTKGLFIGSIQFPTTLEQVPAVRIFCGGNKIPCEINETSKRITFTLPEDKRRTVFPLIITQHVNFEVEENTNTIKYLKIPEKQSYKLYTLELLKLARESDDTQTDDLPYSREWLIQEEKNVLVGGRIPDESIVIYFNPTYVQELKGGTAFELPRIIIKKNVAKLAGSEEKLHEAAKSLLLSSLDLNAIHANVQAKLSHEHHHRTLITLVT